MNLPSNPEAEEAVLCAFLSSPQTVGALMAERNIQSSDFFTDHNATLANVLMEMWRESKPIDFLSVSIELKHRGRWEELEKAGYNWRFSGGGIASAAGYYLDFVQETSQLRRIALLCASKSQEAIQTGAEAKTVMAGLSEGITGISVGASKATVKTMKELVMEKVARIQDNTEEKNVVLTGIDGLDKHSPLKLGDMPLISGERKAGKSILAMNIAVNCALRGDHVLYFSLEDRSEKVMDRMFAKVSQIPMIRHSSRGLSDGDYGKITMASCKLAECAMTIRDDVYDLLGIVAVIRQEKVKFPAMKVVVVDYAQLVRFPMPKGSLREQEVATISRTLRLLAMELEVAILLLCQLNKDGDTRESKALEQDCTAMWKVTHASPEDCGKRIIAIPFQRNGDSGIAFPVTFMGATARIEEFHAEYEE